jgi:hypothetical protein
MAHDGVAAIVSFETGKRMASGLNTFILALVAIKTCSFQYGPQDGHIPDLPILALLTGSDNRNADSSNLNR